MAIINDYFRKFYENIQLTIDQKNDAKTKYTGVFKKLHSHYYPNAEYNGNTKLLVGSYGKKTNIRPPRDVDVIFKLPWSIFNIYDDNSGNKQSQLLQDVRAILGTKYSDTTIKANGKVVVVNFVDGTHKIEVIPAWENGDKTFLIPDSTNGGQWEKVDYRTDIDAIKASEKETGYTRFLIRTIKKWSNTCTVGLSSFEIEQVALQFFAAYEEEVESLGKLVRDYLEYFYNLSQNEQLKSHLNTARKRAIKAIEFEENSKVEQAVEEWKKIFGDDFPSKIKTKDTFDIHNIAKLNVDYPSATEEDLYSKYRIKTKVNQLYVVHLDAEVSGQDGFRPGSLTWYIFNGYPLLKKKSLLFKAKHNVELPYIVKWKVRNYGDEAQRANSLRGQIYNDDGSESRKESTLYKGEHYVECYIIKDNTCVAIGRILVPIGSAI